MNILFNLGEIKTEGNLVKITFNKKVSPKEAFHLVDPFHYCYPRRGIHTIKERKKFKPIIVQGGLVNPR